MSISQRKFHVRRTVAKVNNPKNLSVMVQLGIDIAVSVRIILRLIEREVDTTAIKQIVRCQSGGNPLSVKFCFLIIIN